MVSRRGSKGRNNQQRGQDSPNSAAQRRLRWLRRMLAFKAREGIGGVDPGLQMQFDAGLVLARKALALLERPAARYEPRILRVDFNRWYEEVEVPKYAEFCSRGTGALMSSALGWMSGRQVWR